jgi:hypothetical protein
MWEARAVAGRLEDAVTWVQADVLPSALAAGASDAEAFRSGAPEERVVVITRWPVPTEWVEPPAPSGVLERSHAWQFEPV